MDFVVDRVSEDSFYENLLLGLPRALDKLSNVTNTMLERAPPNPHNIICNWEQKFGVLLPEDLRSLYASTNGLLYTYNFHDSEEIKEENKITGRIQVNSLNDLTQVFGYEIKPDPGTNFEKDIYELRLGPDSKVFELVNIYGTGRVVLAYINHRYSPTIWLHNADMKFYFLARDFTTYLRMCIHHLGIPFWEFSFTPDGIPEWSETIFRLLAPSVLPQHRRLEDMDRTLRQRVKEDTFDVPLNKIDSNVLRTGRGPDRVMPTEIGGVDAQNNSPAPDRKKPTKGKLTRFVTKKSSIQKK